MIHESLALSTGEGVPTPADQAIDKLHAGSISSNILSDYVGKPKQKLHWTRPQRPPMSDSSLGAPSKHMWLSLRAKESKQGSLEVSSTKDESANAGSIDRSGLSYLRPPQPLEIAHASSLINRTVRSDTSPRRLMNRAVKFDESYRQLSNQEALIMSREQRSNDWSKETITS